MARSVQEHFFPAYRLLTVLPADNRRRKKCVFSYRLHSTGPYSAPQMERYNFLPALQPKMEWYNFLPDIAPASACA